MSKAAELLMVFAITFAALVAGAYVLNKQLETIARIERV